MSHLQIGSNNIVIQPDTKDAEKYLVIQDKGYLPLTSDISKVTLPTLKFQKGEEVYYPQQEFMPDFYYEGVLHCGSVLANKDNITGGYGSHNNYGTMIYWGSITVNVTGKKVDNITGISSASGKYPWVTTISFSGKLPLIDYPENIVFTLGNTSYILRGRYVSSYNGEVQYFFDPLVTPLPTSGSYPFKIQPYN